MSRATLSDHSSTTKPTKLFLTSREETMIIIGSLLLLLGAGTAAGNSDRQEPSEAIIVLGCLVAVVGLGMIFYKFYLLLTGKVKIHVEEQPPYAHKPDECPQIGKKFGSTSRTRARDSGATPSLFGGSSGKGKYGCLDCGLSWESWGLAIPNHPRP